MSIYKQQFKEIFNLHQELRVLIDPVLDEYPIPQSSKQGFILYAVAKSHKTQAAILLLCEKGFGQDASILSRSIFELAVNAKYICKDATDYTAQQFFDYDWIRRKRMLDAVSNNPDVKKELDRKDPGGKMLIQVKLEAAKMSEKYYNGKMPSNWSGLTIENRAHEVGLTHEYKTLYSLLCDQSHPNSRNTNDYFIDNQGVFEVNAGADVNWIRESLIATFQFFIIIVDCWNKEFKFGLDSNVQDINEKLIKLTHEYT